MSMYTYVKLEDLKAAMDHIELTVRSGSTTLDGEHFIEINVVVSHKHSSLVCVGELELSATPTVCFGSSCRDIIFAICTRVGIPFSFH